MKESLLLYNLKLNCLIFSSGLNSSLIIFIRTYTVNYRNALDGLRVRINIVLFKKIFYIFVLSFTTVSTLQCYNPIISLQSSGTIEMHLASVDHTHFPEHTVNHSH